MRLQDVCTVFSDGDWIESKDQSDKGIRLVQTGNIGEGLYLEKEERAKYVSEETFESLKCTEIYPGDILISRLPEPVGRACIIPPKKERMITAVDCTICRVDESIVSKEYLCYFMRSNAYYTKLLGSVTGTTRKRISRKNLGNIELEIPPKEEQTDVVSQLERLINVINSRNKELQLLDDIIKARFVEMFGDIKINEYGWKKCTFKDVSTKITDGEHGTVPRVDEGEGYLYFMARNITKEGEIDLSETSFVPPEIHEKIYKRCNPEKDDLLLVCVGATIGKCTLVSEIMGEFSMARSVALIKPNKEMVTSNFLINLLRSEAIQNDIDHCSHAAAQAGLYTNMINSLEAFVPPMDLQIEFDTFCEQVDKSKLKE